MNDEVDRPGDAKVSRASKPVVESRNPVTHNHSMDMPLVTGNYDEVDKPSNTTQNSTKEISEMVTTKYTIKMTSEEKPMTSSFDYTEDHFEVDYDQENDFIQIDIVDSSQGEVSVNSSQEETFVMKVDEKRAKRDSTITDVDGPGGTPVTTPLATPNSSSEDGPFDRMFPSKPPTYQMNRATDGINSQHSVYFPQAPKTKNHKFAINSDTFYDMRTFPRGRMVLINVKNFKRSSGMSNYPRHGTDRDADMLCKLFLDLGFQVDRYDDPTRSEIKTALKATANADYSKLSCSACAILTHGEKDIIYGTDAPLEINDLTSLFQTKSLAGKPKLFFFQACRGSKYMEPHDAVDGPGGQDPVALQLPLESDFLYAYSTVEDYYSWRNSSKGSWFVNALVSVFRQHAHKLDIMRMLSRVNAEICLRKSHTDERSTDNKKQIGSFVTQLRKELFFFPPSGPLKN